MNNTTHTMESADYLLLAGHLCGALSVLLISAATIWKMGNRLPVVPLFHPDAGYQPERVTAKPYWDN
jgi:hypothetical protein